jgi:hypothetical protein
VGTGTVLVCWRSRSVASTRGPVVDLLVAIHSGACGAQSMWHRLASWPTRWVLPASRSLRRSGAGTASLSGTTSCTARRCGPWPIRGVTLAAVACATSSLRIGPLVTPLARRRVHKVAREEGAAHRQRGPKPDVLYVSQVLRQDRWSRQRR